MMFNRCDQRAAVERFVGEEYIQHDPHMVDGKHAFIECFERIATEFPGRIVNVIPAVTETDLGVLHCHQN